MPAKIIFDETTLSKIETKLTKKSCDRLVDHFIRQGKTLAQAYDLILTLCETEGVENYYGCYESFRVSYYRRINQKQLPA